MATDKTPPSRQWRRPTSIVTRSMSKRRAGFSSISELGDDLLVEILIRSFPNPKSACRCRSVCKHWNSLISSPRFNLGFISHYQKKHMNVLLQLPYNSIELKSLILSFLPPMPPDVEKTFTVFDCFKDLVLCGFFDARHSLSQWGIMGSCDADSKQIRTRSYLICNPFTKNWIALPSAPDCRRSWSPLVRLVCEPRISANLDLGDDQEREAFVYSEYRFRVVCIHQDRYRAPVSMIFDMFCSESGEWIKDALVLDHYSMILRYNISWCNGELFWMTTRDGGIFIAAFNPFRIDIPPTFFDTSTAFSGAGTIPMFTVSQDAPYLIAYNDNRIFLGGGASDDNVDLGVTMMRLDRDRKCWLKQCREMIKKKSSSSTTSNSSWCCHCGCNRKRLIQPFLNPYNPEVVFFKCIACGSGTYSCDLTKEEGGVKFVGGQETLIHYAEVFEPRFSGWPTPVPRYKEFREHIPWLSS